MFLSFASSLLVGRSSNKAVNCPNCCFIQNDHTNSESHAALVAANMVDLVKYPCPSLPPNDCPIPKNVSHNLSVEKVHLCIKKCPVGIILVTKRIVTSIHFPGTKAITSHMLSSTVMGGALTNSSAAQVSSQDLCITRDGKLGCETLRDLS